MSNVGINTLKRVVTGNPIYDDELKIAPWEIAAADFAVCPDRALIGGALENILAEHALLVLTSMDGRRYGNTILVKVDDDCLEIDRPFDFHESGISSCRAFFKDITGVWCFFELEVVKVTTFGLFTALPVTLHRLHKRQHHRVRVPAGTRVLFRHGGLLHENFLLKNLSSSGMLICTDSGAEDFAENSDITEISLAMAPKRSSGQPEGGRRSFCRLSIMGELSAPSAIRRRI